MNVLDVVIAAKLDPDVNLFKVSLEIYFKLPTNYKL